MFKAYYRFLLKYLKNDPSVIYRRYLANLRVFKTDKVLFILVNCLEAGEIIVYYYYRPERIFLCKERIRVRDKRLRHETVARFILSKVRKLTEDEVYRKYQIDGQEYFSQKRERHK